MAQSNKLPKFLMKDGAKNLLVLSKVVLDSMNLWPDNQNWLNKCLHVFYLVSYTFFIYGNIYYVFTSNDVGSSAYALTVLSVLIETVVRRILLYMYKHRFSKLLNDMYFVFWSSTLTGEAFHKELTKGGNFLFAFCSAYTFSALMATTMYVTMPLSTQNTPYMTAYPFHWQKDPFYSILYIWQGFCFMETVACICGWNFFFAGLSYNCIAQFKLLQSYIKENYHKYAHNLVGQKKFINKWIDHHHNVIKVCEELNDLFFYFTLQVYLITIKTCCLSAFVVTAVPGFSFFGISYFMGHACQLFLYCYIGNELSLVSTELSTSIYMCGWEKCTTDMDLRKSIILIMVRTQKPIRISAGGFGYLSMASFVKIMQFSFSVYTLLDTMMNKDH